MISQDELENVIKAENLDRFNKSYPIARDIMGKCVYYTREVIKRFPKLSYSCYDDECLIRGKKDGSFPHVKVTSYERNNQIKIGVVSIDGYNRKYLDFDEMLQHIERDIKYLFIKKGKYTLEDLQ